MMKTKITTTTEFICLNNEGCATSMEPRKIYSVVSDEEAAERSFLRVTEGVRKFGIHR
jgi:hypothetical protein